MPHALQASAAAPSRLRPMVSVLRMGGADANPFGAVARRRRSMSDEGKPAKRAARGSTVEHLPLPAHSIEAEQSVLGCLMLDAASWHEVRHLQVDDFFRADHRLIFEAMLELRPGGGARDAVTVADPLASNVHPQCSRQIRACLHLLRTH